jgi:hypothetical protein
MTHLFISAVLGGVFIPVLIELVQKKITECVSQGTAIPSNCIPHYLYFLDQPQIFEKQIINFLIKNNPNLKKDYVERIAKSYCMESKQESINTAIAVAQMALETGFLQFTGIVKKS